VRRKVGVLYRSVSFAVSFRVSCIVPLYRSEKWVSCIVLLYRAVSWPHDSRRGGGSPYALSRSKRCSPARLPAARCGAGAHPKVKTKWKRTPTLVAAATNIRRTITLPNYSAPRTSS